MVMVCTCEPPKLRSARESHEETTVFRQIESPLRFGWIPVYLCWCLHTVVIVVALTNDDVYTQPSVTASLGFLDVYICEVESAHNRTAYMRCKTHKVLLEGHEVMESTTMFVICNC